jgi:hypothetical protein
VIKSNGVIDAKFCQTWGSLAVTLPFFQQLIGPWIASTARNAPAFIKLNYQHFYSYKKQDSGNHCKLSLFSRLPREKKTQRKPSLLPACLALAEEMVEPLEIPSSCL